MNHDPIYTRRGLEQNSRSLPLIISWKHKWIFGLLLFGFTSLLYFFTNRYPFSTPTKLPLSSFDQIIPFVPMSGWIYLSGFIYVLTSYFLNRCVVSLNKHIYSYLFTFVISAIIFSLFPVIYPRELYPLPLNTDSWTKLLFEFIRGVDSPANCLPSLHVSIAFQIAFGFLEDRKEYFPFILIWAISISLSTLTTKQHYLVDVATGLALAVFVHLLFHHILTYRLRRR